ncbi:MAG TPA: sigma-70 family RNA polymerase sigma factor [Planctomycetota bacterium]|nr:sigma-70 family RNA polymerase sigma factor [Planctomycetota bacterium]
MASPEPTATNDAAGATGDGGRALMIEIAKAQAGDRDALNRLFERHEPLLLRFARKKLGAPLRTLDETRDVLHDAYQVVMRKIGGFVAEDSKSFARWLRGIVTRVVLQKAGASHLRRRRELAEDASVADGTLTPFTRLSVEELLRVRYRILRTFDRVDRKIYRLRARGISTTAIAPMVGLTDRAVRMRFAKTDAQIRVRMQRYVECGAL